MSIPFVYRWEHIPTGKWYIGSRTAIGCHPKDGYITSSSIVKEAVETCPQDWRREILATGTAREMLKLEIDLLISLDAVNDPSSLNQTNGTGKIVFKELEIESSKPKIKLRDILEQIEDGNNS